MAEANEKKFKILLVDDDVIFVKVMRVFCERNHIALTCVVNVRQAYQLKEWDFDVAIIDYDLGCVTGVQLATFLQHNLNSKAVILISANESAGMNDWPGSIKEFLPKSAGAEWILHKALQLAH